MLCYLDEGVGFFHAYMVVVFGWVSRSYNFLTAWTPHLSLCIVYLSFMSTCIGYMLVQFVGLFSFCGGGAIVVRGVVFV